MGEEREKNGRKGLVDKYHYCVGDGHLEVGAVVLFRIHNKPSERGVESVDLPENRAWRDVDRANLRTADIE